MTGSPAGCQQVSDRPQYVYQCPTGHARHLRQYRDRPPLCNEKGCGLRTTFVANPAGTVQR